MNPKVGSRNKPKGGRTSSAWGVDQRKRVLAINIVVDWGIFPVYMPPTWYFIEIQEHYVERFYITAFGNETFIDEPEPRGHV